MEEGQTKVEKEKHFYFCVAKLTSHSELPYTWYYQVVCWFTNKSLVCVLLVNIFSNRDCQDWELAVS